MRSVAAVLAGFAIMSVLVVAGIAAAAALMLGGSQVPTTPYLAVNLGYSAAASALGGYLTARLASRRPLTHALVLAALVGALGVASALAAPPSSGQPAWYPWVVSGLGVVGVALGGSTLARARHA
jgi:hypothetical protein